MLQRSLSTNIKVQRLPEQAATVGRLSSPLRPFEQLVNRILCGPADQLLKTFPNESIDCVVTSPPYWGLRDYGVKGQLGLEPNFAEYINNLCDIFDEVQRVLKKSGTCWVNIGDTYGGSCQAWGKKGDHIGGKNGIDRRPTKISCASRPPTYALLPKCLLQIPSRFALEMINRGWILRNEIIWQKPNCMPASVKDRFTVDFEKLFFFVKSRQYSFEQQFEELRNRARLTQRFFNPQSLRKRTYGDKYISALNPKTAEASRLRILKRGRNKRCVWSIGTRPFPGSHFAVYPPQLIETPIKAGCPEGGIVLDPFVGSGTTALVARNLGRRFIGIDLNPDYVRMARDRLKDDALLAA